jgi:hypothetical protein
MYIPLSNKLSLHKNKKKRVGAQKRSVFEDDAEGDVPKLIKITEKAADQYVLAARGYSAKEVQEANANYKALHCEAEITRDAAGGMPGITFFRTDEDL